MIADLVGKGGHVRTVPIPTWVKNAVDALSGRGGRIEVEVESSDSLGRVSVRDDGPGVTPGDNTPRIWVMGTRRN